jgi:hypothetical protein
MSQIDDFDSPFGTDAGSIWLNDLFESARLPGTTGELASEADVVGAMVRTIAQPALVSDLNARRRHSISKPAARIAIAAAALFVGTSTVAATGNLPDGAQSAFARASSHIGVDIPDPHSDRADSSAPTTSPSPGSTVMGAASAVTVAVGDVPGRSEATFSTTANSNPRVADSTDVPPVTNAGVGPDATGPAKQGLCRAWAAHRSDSPANQHSTAMRNLQAAAAAAGLTVDEFCADVLGPDSTEVATTDAGTTPDTAVEGQGKENKDKDPPGQGDNSKSEKGKEKKPKGEG